jgi:hypothetical protein
VKPVIRFLQTDSIIQENAGTVLLPVQVIPAPETQTVILIVAKDSNTINGTDYNLQQGTLLTFPANFPGNQFINVPILDNSTHQQSRVFRIILRKIESDTTFIIGSDSVMRITIIDNDPLIYQYPISLIRGNNSVEGGCADSLGVRCSVKGLLCGRNFLASDGEFSWAIRDASGSIALYLDENPYENLREGDSVRITGVVSQLNGLSFLFVENLEKTADSLQAPTPEVVDSLSEATESALITLSGYQILNPAEWTGNPQGFSVTISNGIRQYKLWMDNELIPYPTAPPEGLLSITGIGDQDDDSAPYESGYRIRLVRNSGIQPFSPINKSEIGGLKVSPNPFSTSDHIFLNSEGNKPVTIMLSDPTGKILLSGIGESFDLEKQLNSIISSSTCSTFFLQAITQNRRTSTILVRKP